MNIRLALENDMPEILVLYKNAREFMKKTGNPNQWGDIYPEEGLLKKDIELKRLYVMEEDSICGAFVFIIGEDQTYKVIDDGAWLNNEKYGTIHRIASIGTGKHVFENCLNFCFSKINNIRIDTHQDNKIMQHLILKNDFNKCGIIYVMDGSPRIAFQKII